MLPLDSMAELRTLAANFAADVGEFYVPWIEPSRQFHSRYLDEQLRKAAVSPQTSSEIDRVSSRERNGDELNDRMFLLTFVGGPGPAGGSTDVLADYLRRQKLGGLFFVIGNRLQQRRDAGAAGSLGTLYDGQCVGIQGWEYRPMPSGRIGRTRCAEPRRGSRQTCRSSTCRCSDRPMGSAGPMARRS